MADAKTSSIKSLDLCILGLQDGPDIGAIHMFQNMFEKVLK